jgi:beta-lactamase superfamily II metal-dependent hydrolase
MFRVTMLPAEEGDSLFIETGASDCSHRILVDGGRSRTASEVLRPFLEKLPLREGKTTVDLVVITHIDSDHIDGIVSLLKMAGPLTIGEIWFNDYAQVRAATGKRPLPKSPSFLEERSELDVLGVKQAKALTEVVKAHQWPLNAAFEGAPILVDASGALPVINLVSGAVLTVLGPSRSKLAAFEPVWHKEIAKLAKEELETLEQRQQPIPALVTIEAIARQRDESDTRKPNGTSIAFVVEYKNRRALFLADAHPDDMAKSIVRYKHGQDRIFFDAVKVSHHGSAANNTSDLINLLESPLWLVSTNGSFHQHPDPEAISRILLAPVRPKDLVFNYRSVFNAVWDDSQLSEHYEYRAVFGSLTEPFSVELDRDR